MIVIFCALLGCGDQNDRMTSPLKQETETVKSEISSGFSVGDYTPNNLPGVYYVHTPTKITNMTNMVAIGWKAGTSGVTDNVVLIGDNANSTNQWEMVIKFTDGSELRQPLPPGKIIDFSIFWNCWRTNR